MSDAGRFFLNMILGWFSLNSLPDALLFVKSHFGNCITQADCLYLFMCLNQGNILETLEKLGKLYL